MNQDIVLLNEKVKEFSPLIDKITSEVSQVIVGQRYMVERLLIGLLSDGHILLEGVPGLAKTLTVKTLSDCITAKFQRIQFTPDMLPADIIGTMVYNQKETSFITQKGPIFNNIILADEINRAPAKVQSALLEAMQEKQVTISKESFKLEEPFLVLATQNPIEQEGTYPLPEAQLDRFMLKIRIEYPNIKEEKEIIRRITMNEPVEIKPVMTTQQIIDAREMVKKIYVDEKIIDYVTDIVFATRMPENYKLDIKELIKYGASPRASINLIKAAKAHAFLHHRGYVTPEDVRTIGMDVLRHRIAITFEAEARDLTAEDIVKKVFDAVEVP